MTPGRANALLSIKPACSFPSRRRRGSSRSCSASRLRLRRGSGTPSRSCRTVQATWWHRGEAAGSSRSWRPYKTVRLAPHSCRHDSLIRVAFGSLGAQAPPCNARACKCNMLFTKKARNFLAKDGPGSFDQPDENQYSIL